MEWVAAVAVGYYFFRSAAENARKDRAAFLVYERATRSEIATENPGIRGDEAAKFWAGETQNRWKLRCQWSALTDEEKAPYHAIAAAEGEENARKERENARKEREENAPKEREENAFLVYERAIRSEIATENPGIRGDEAAKFWAGETQNRWKLRCQWSALTDEEKAPYHAIAAAEGEENARKEREENARQREREEVARQREREEIASKEREENARKKREEVARQREREEIARKEREENARKKREEVARQKEREENARKEREENARKEREEIARKEREENARKEREENARKKREENARQREREEIARKERERYAQIEREQKERLREEKARNALHTAARLGDVNAARAALTATPNLIYRPDGDGCLPLHRACEGGHLALAKLLHKKNPTAVNAADTKHGGWTPLHYAVSGAAKYEKSIDEDFFSTARKRLSGLAEKRYQKTIKWLLNSTTVDVLAATTDVLPQTAVNLAEEIIASDTFGDNTILELLQKSLARREENARKEREENAKKRPREPDADEDSASKRPARAAASGTGPTFGTQEQVSAFVQSGAALPVPETDSDVQRTQLKHNRSQFALRYDLVNKADAQPGHSTTKSSTALNKAKAFVTTRETNCRKFKIGITDNPRKRAAHGFPHSGYQVQYDRMDIIYRGTRDTAGALEAALIESFGANGATPSDKCANDAPGDEGPRKDAVYYTYLVSL